jgi:hypothetical protein
VLHYGFADLLFEGIVQRARDTYVAGGRHEGPAQAALSPQVTADHLIRRVNTTLESS